MVSSSEPPPPPGAPSLHPHPCPSHWTLASLPSAGRAQLAREFFHVALFIPDSQRILDLLLTPNRIKEMKSWEEKKPNQSFKNVQQALLHRKGQTPKRPRQVGAFRKWDKKSRGKIWLPDIYLETIFWNTLGSIFRLTNNIMTISLFVCLFVGLNHIATFWKVWVDLFFKEKPPWQ